MSDQRDNGPFSPSFPVSIEQEKDQDMAKEMDQSAHDSDKEMDDFEDALDNAQDTFSVRSSTRKTTSIHMAQDAGDATDEKAELEEALEAPSPIDLQAEVQDESEQDHGPSLAQRQPSVSPPQRLSLSSNAQLDNVSLDDETSPQPTGSEHDEVKTSAGENGSHKTMSLSSITNALPSLPWSPGAQGSPNKNLDALQTAAAAPSSPGIAPSQPAATLPAPPPRKLASAFSWLSKSSSRDLTNALPPLVSPRRNTASSTTTLTSNPEMMLGKLGEKGGGANGVNGNASARNSLKDRFKAMRLKEEAGVTRLHDEGDSNRFTPLVSNGLPGAVAATPAEEKEAAAVQTSLSSTPATVTLAPGTASGTAAGPSTLSDQPVDWDLWQSVVYEGPAAVVKTSSEGLNKAITAGIPSAIRGVIWQVLAQSQSEELETVYRELVIRGTGKEKDRQSSGSPATGSNNNSIHSSASSVHSGDSALSGSTTHPLKDEDAASAKAQAAVEAQRKKRRVEGSTTHPLKDEDAASAKAQAAVEAQRRKRRVEDVATIQRLEKTIRRDLGVRTAYSKFAAAQGLQEGLYGVCKAYALFDEEVGYAQGMNFLIMPLLFNMSEEEAFCLLVRLMNQYHLRDLFIQDMPGLHMHLYQFERLLEDTEPALYCHLRRRGISPHLYATQWFLTLFSYRFPLQLVLRIYDLILSEGLSAILKFGIVLMQKNAQMLLGMTDMTQLTSFLRDRLFDVYIEAAPTANSILENGFFGSSTSSMDKEVYRADQLVHDACEVKITPEVLKFYQAEWEEKTMVEKEQQLELETLRSQNTSYVAKIRKLEERLQAVDREQADLATELVHTKVENEELKDQNESLQGQVRELKIVIEKQPVAIEDQWRLDRDALIERNQRVHEMNEKVEKEMAELEEQLVQTKMRYAEINSQHEALLRKWNELKRTFA